MEGEERIEADGVGKENSMGSARQAGPTWRALAVSVIVAVVLSVAATLLFGGSYRFTGSAVSSGCGQVGDCCPAPENR